MDSDNSVQDVPEALHLCFPHWLDSPGEACEPQHEVLLPTGSYKVTSACRQNRMNVFSFPICLPFMWLSYDATEPSSNSSQARSSSA